MKYHLLIIILFNGILGFSQSEIDNYTAFIKTQNQSPKDYIFELFETNDIIILGERDHRDTTQYDLILDILKDKRFVEKIGHIYTEVGVVNQTEWANKIVKGNYKNKETFEKDFVKLYRELDFNPLWDKYNMIKYLKGIYEINRNLDNEAKITIGLTDCAFEWNNMSHEKYMKFVNTNLKPRNVRDSIMASNFMQLYEQQTSINGQKKALLIQSRPHAINLDISYKKRKIKKTGSFIKDRYGDKVKIIVFNWYEWMPPEWYKWMPEHPIQLTNQGRWDAAFEMTGNKSIGFNIENSPFGLTEFDYAYEQGIKYQDVIDGIIFYLPFYQFTCTRGLPNIVDVEFAKKYIKRTDIVNGNIDYSSDSTAAIEKEDWDDFRSFECEDYKMMKKQMRKWIKTKHNKRK